MITTFVVAFALNLVGILLALGLVRLFSLAGRIRLAQVKGNTGQAVLIFIVMTRIMIAVMGVWNWMVVVPMIRPMM